jgi:hypothetical protein
MSTRRTISMKWFTQGGRGEGSSVREGKRPFGGRFPLP